MLGLSTKTLLPCWKVIFIINLRVISIFIEHMRNGQGYDMVDS